MSIRPKLSTKEKVGYSLGDFASVMYWTTFSMFLLYFYTDVFGISAAAAGTMFLVTRIWDTFDDPLMGIIADRTSTKWGKFRPFILWGAIPFVVIGILTFTTPEFSDTGKIVYAYVTYSFMMMLYTFVNIPYSALMGVISPNSQERTEVASFRVKSEQRISENNIAPVFPPRDDSLPCRPITTSVATSANWIASFSACSSSTSFSAKTPSSTTSAW